LICELKKTFVFYRLKRNIDLFLIISNAVCLIKSIDIPIMIRYLSPGDRLMRVITRILLSAILVVSSVATLAAAEPDEPRIGLVLSGGGARGSAHIGVLKALEELGVTVDMIAGTSMGAIIGAFYAAGYNAAEIEEILAGMDWEAAMSDRPARVDRTMRKKELEDQLMIPYRLGFNDGKIQMPLGLIEGQHLDQVFHQILEPVGDIQDFDDLAIPYRAIATDLVTGDAVVLASGSLADAVRASMSVPGVFSPLTIDGRMLVDGGLANNLPVDVLREMGADVVIAVDISSPLLTRQQMTSVLSVTEQLTNFLTRRNTEEQLALMGEDDILIVPELGNFSAANFAQATEIVATGYEAGMAQRSALESLARQAPGAARKSLQVAPKEYIVHFIEIENGSVLNDEIIRSRLDAEIGKPLDRAALFTSLDRIYSLDQFRSVTYDLVKNDAGQTGVLVRALPREWGPNYLQFGLELSSDFSGESNYQIETAYLRNALNSLGGELRVNAAVGRKDEIGIDFYQPVDTQARWFVQPEIVVTRENYDYWEEGNNIADLELKTWRARFGLGRNFSTTDRATLGYNFGRTRAGVVTGPPGLVDEDFDIGELTLRYLHDSRDSSWFPTSGMRHQLEYLYAAESLGASSDYRQASATGSVAFSLGRNTGLLSYSFGYSIDDAAPIERWYRLGGFGRLSGLAPDQLLGRHAALVTLAYYRRLNDLDIVPAFAGLMLEGGNVWEFEDDIGFDDLRYSGNLFIGAETPLGPVYLSVGYSDSDDYAAYFYLGNPFRSRRFD
jgi:NTE family protein